MSEYELGANPPSTGEPPADPRTALAEPRITLAELLNRTNATATGCREWNGWKRRRGYGGIKVDKVEWAAHRLAYTLEYGPIPDGQLVLHRCDNPPCINPAHLFLGTQHDNIQDAVSKGKFPKRTHCKRGHELTPENSVLAGYGRTCLTCRQASNRVRSQRRRARLAALSAAVEDHMEGLTPEELAWHGAILEGADAAAPKVDGATAALRAAAVEGPEVTE